MRCRESRCGRSLGEERADRLAFVKSERRDVDETDGVRRIGAERSDYLTAMPSTAAA